MIKINKNEEPLKKEHENFRDYINGSYSYIITLKEAMKNVEVADYVLKSSNDGFSYKIGEI